MPEPVTIIVIGAALWAMLKPKPVISNPPAAQLQAAPSAVTAGDQPVSQAGAGTTTDAPFATNGSVTSPVPISDVMVTPPPDVSLAVPLDLVAALDNQTALAMRAYAAMYPDDFRMFLDKYADRVVLRNDMMFEALTDPPEQGYELTPAMMASMGNAAYKVGQALNGVYVGRSVDLFGVSASVAGQIPGINPDLVSSLQGLAMAYRAITSIQQVAAIAAANGVGWFSVGAGMTSAPLEGAIFGTEVAGGITAYPGLAALPFAGVLMAVGLVVDIGFTIIGDKPDLQKAIDVALDVASLAVLFIPGIGIVIAIVIQLVKFIIDMFGEELFGGGMTHEQREILETARYGEAVNPMYPALVAAYTPRELWRTIVEWGSGYCGGRHVVAMAVSLVLHVGDTFMLGGQPYTVPPSLDGLAFGFGDNEQPGGCYWIRSGPLAAITNDEQAWLLGVYAPLTDGVRLIARAQAGIIDWRKEQFQTPTEQIIATRAIPMHDFLVKHRLSLDQIDQIALEYRAQPHLTALAKAFGWPTWQEFFAAVVSEEWYAFAASITNGTLADFARMNGHSTMYAFRAAALASYETPYALAQSGIARAMQQGQFRQADLDREIETFWAQQAVQPGGTQFLP